MEHHPQDLGAPVDDGVRDGHELVDGERDLDSGHEEREPGDSDHDADGQEREGGEQRTDLVASDDAGPVPTSAFEPTGRPDIDTILDRLVDLDGAPTNHHADVYEDVHRRLHETLLAAGESGDSSEGAS